jgi:CubicO group peptidase (beta-lactamase class C family)
VIDLDRARPIVEGVFAEQAALLDLPAIAWGLVSGGELVLAHDADAVYRIASMTKSFTAAAVLLLRDERVLSLDDPIDQHAPELAHVKGPTRDSPPLLVRHLLTMSAGFATDDAWADRHLDVGDDDLDGWLAGGVTFAAAPGTVFEYSNLGYGLAGRVVLRVTGRRLQDIVQERLLRPLGMARTTWEAPPDAVPGYRRRDGTLLVEPPLGDGAIAPMGGLFTTVRDLARWVAWLLDAFPPRDDPDDGPLSRASRREMQQAHRLFLPRRMTARDGRVRTSAGGYGLGLNIVLHDALGFVVTHSGGLPGFGSNMRWSPTAGAGLIALGNLTYAPMAEATAAVLDALVANGLVAADPPAPSDAVQRAAACLVGLHNTWDSDAAGDLFADNVFLDAPEARRRDAAARLGDAHGPFTLARVEVESATSATAIAHGNGVELRVEFDLHPLVPPRVQHYEATVVGAAFRDAGC